MKRACPYDPARMGCAYMEWLQTEESVKYEWMQTGCRVLKVFLGCLAAVEAQLQWHPAGFIQWPTAEQLRLLIAKHLSAAQQAVISGLGACPQKG